MRVLQLSRRLPIHLAKSNPTGLIEQILPAPAEENVRTLFCEKGRRLTTFASLRIVPLCSASFIPKRAAHTQVLSWDEDE
jgi:hypothetical protein